MNFGNVKCLIVTAIVHECKPNVYFITSTKLGPNPHRWTIYAGRYRAWSSRLKDLGYWNVWYTRILPPKWGAYWSDEVTNDWRQFFTIWRIYGGDWWSVKWIAGSCAMNYWTELSVTFGNGREPSLESVSVPYPLILIVLFVKNCFVNYPAINWFVTPVILLKVWNAVFKVIYFLRTSLSVNSLVSLFFLTRVET